MKIGLFITCFNDTLFPNTGKSLVELLERLGHQVEFPREQTCCGQMHLNTGYRQEAVALARRFLDVFSAYEAVVSPSASCVGMVRHEFERLADGNDELRKCFTELGSRVFELSEFLVDRLGLEDVGAYFPHRVTYHPSCHSLRVLRLGDRPLRLLQNVRGIELVMLPRSDECCGFGGTFSLKNADTSTAMVTDKVQHILSTGAEVCCAVDNSCLMNIQGALHRERAGVRTVHLAEILAST